MLVHLFFLVDVLFCRIFPSIFQLEEKGYVTCNRIGQRLLGVADGKPFYAGPLRVPYFGRTIPQFGPTLSRCALTIPPPPLFPLAPPAGPALSPLKSLH